MFFLSYNIFIWKLKKKLMRRKTVWEEKKVIQFLKENGIKAKASLKKPLWFSSIDFRILIKENHKWHKTIICTHLTKKQVKWILSLQEQFPNWFKKHFRGIEKVFANDTKMLFYDYDRPNSLYEGINLEKYLNSVLLSKSPEDITKDAQNLSYLFANETMCIKNDRLIGYTYTRTPDSEDWWSVFFLTNKQDKNDTNFTIANPSQIEKREITGDVIIGFVKALIFSTKWRLIDELKQKNKNIDQITEKYSKWIYFLISLLSFFTRSLPNAYQNKFITKLDEEMNSYLFNNEINEIIEHTASLVALGEIDANSIYSNIISKKTWDEFIAFLKKEADGNKDENKIKKM